MARVTGTAKAAIRRRRFRQRCDDIDHAGDFVRQSGTIAVQSTIAFAAKLARRPVRCERIVADGTTRLNAGRLRDIGLGERGTKNDVRHDAKNTRRERCFCAN
jgi:hypothetical protein